MTFKREVVKFGLEDVGAQVLDQISTDIYSTPGSILRELVKNAYDAYLEVDADDLEEEGLPRAIQVRRSREGLTGTLRIADNGVGQTLADLKKMVQISISTKPDDVPTATGFRGLGSWSVLGAGSRIVVESTRKGDPHLSRLTFDVRKIYAAIKYENSLADILNDPKCILFETSASDVTAEEHFTTVEIICDGPVEKLSSGHEINRLYRYTDPEEKDLLQILINSCPIPYASEGGSYSEIHKIYTKTQYTPTEVMLDGKKLERHLPKDLAIHTTEIKVGKAVAAYVWYADDPKRAEILKLVPTTAHVGGTGMQIVKRNVPLGVRNKFKKGSRSTLDWYVGEVHLALPDLLPDASGDDLRASSVGEQFVEGLQELYETLDQQAETKSYRLSRVRQLKKAMSFAQALNEGTLSGLKIQEARLEIEKAAALIRQLASVKKKKTLTEKEQLLRDAAAEPDLKAAFDETRAVLKKYDMLNAESGPTKGTKGTKASKQMAATSANGRKTKEFQARVATYIPRLTAIGLDGDQVQQVLEIISELFADLVGVQD